MAHTKPLPTQVRDELLAVNDVADYLKIHRAGVYALMRDGELPFVMVGARRRVRMSDVQRYLDTTS